MSSYSSSQKWLHKFALGNKIVAKQSFVVNEMFAKKEYDIPNSKKVFVSGLARSGTTMLTRYLNEHPQFCSLTYQDMPFPLMPTFWRTIYKPNTDSVQERAHGDGIKVKYDSVEEIEEFFWKIMSNDAFIEQKTLVFDKIDLKKAKKFETYISAIFNCYTADQPVYLSKNNNHVVRFKDIVSIPNATLIIPFRDPLGHAGSLLKQHKHFSNEQSKDPFVLDYMNWLGHHEFGNNHKYFDLGNKECNHYLDTMDKEVLEYWLVSWYNYYSYIVDFVKDKENVLLVDYSKFCKSPVTIIESIGDKIGETFEVKDIASYTAPSYNNTDLDSSEWNSKCVKLYQILQKMAI